MKRRFKERHYQLIDQINRFESESTATHVRNTLAAIGRIKNVGPIFWDEGTSQLSRWNHYCDILWVFINADLGRRRFREKQDLATALREFIAEFEHSVHGMYEMLYGTGDDPDNDDNIKQMLIWFDVVYRFSTYAIVSYWIDEKSDHTSVEIKINMTTGKHSHSYSHKKMPKPKEKKHQRGSKKL